MLTEFIKKYKWIFVTEFEIECQLLEEHKQILTNLKLTDIQTYIPTLVYSKAHRCALIIRHENHKLHVVESLPQMPKGFKPKTFFDKDRDETFNCVKSLTEELLLYHNFLFEYYDVINKSILSGTTAVAYISKYWQPIIFNRKIEGNGGNLLVVK